MNLPHDDGRVILGPSQRLWQHFPLTRVTGERYSLNRASRLHPLFTGMLAHTIPYRVERAVLALAALSRHGASTGAVIRPLIPIPQPMACAGKEGRDQDAEEGLMKVIDEGKIRSVKNWQEFVVCEKRSNHDHEGCGAVLEIVEGDLILMYWESTLSQHYYPAVRCPQCGKYNEARRVPVPILDRLYAPTNQKMALFDGYSQAA